MRTECQGCAGVLSMLVIYAFCALAAWALFCRTQ